jgi:hypothetical protein
LRPVDLERNFTVSIAVMQSVVRLVRDDKASALKKFVEGNYFRTPSMSPEELKGTEPWDIGPVLRPKLLK